MRRFFLWPDLISKPVDLPEVPVRPLFPLRAGSVHFPGYVIWQTPPVKRIIMMTILFIVSLLTFIYLVYVLLYPEKF